MQKGEKNGHQQRDGGRCSPAKAETKSKNDKTQKGTNPSKHPGENEEAGEMMTVLVGRKKKKFTPPYGLGWEKKHRPTTHSTGKGGNGKCLMWGRVKIGPTPGRKHAAGAKKESRHKKPPNFSTSPLRNTAGRGHNKTYQKKKSLKQKDPRKRSPLLKARGQHPGGKETGRCCGVIKQSQRKTLHPGAKKTTEYRHQGR